jgi:Flp pilus assembly protein TadB
VNLVVAALAAIATWLALAPAPEPRLSRLVSSMPASIGPKGTDRRLPTLLASGLAAVGVWLLIGGSAGAVLAVACVIAIPRLTRTMESRATRTAREQLERQAPLAADLIAATMASGATMRAALAAVGAAVGEPTAGALRPVLAAMELGADPPSAWQSLTGSSPLGPIRDAIVRSAETGAPLTAVLTRIADDMRRERQVQVEVAARTAGVRAVAPLAACFLPAFVLMGVVPVVASLAGDLLS